MSAIAAILFDIGDTLIHFDTWRVGTYLAAGAKAAHQRLGEWTNPPPLKQYARNIRWAFLFAFLRSRVTRREVRLMEVLARSHARMGLSMDDDQMAEVISCCTSAIRPLFRTDEAAIPVVRRLSEGGIRLGIVSNTFFPRFAIDKVLEDEGLLPFFPIRVFSSEVGYMKPRREIFVEALRQIRVDPQQAMYVGDRVSKDVKGPRQLGMKTVLLKRNGGRPFGRHQPDFVVRCLSEIPDLCERAREDTQNNSV